MKKLEAILQDELYEKCTWDTDISEDGGIYETTCNELYEFKGEFDFKYCPFCGKKIIKVEVDGYYD